MNLHLISDEKFFDPFVEKLESLELLNNNRIVVKECGPLSFIRRKDLVFGRMCDEKLIGNLGKYDKVFIHCFTNDMFEWVSQHTFNELNWMVWGKELYGSDLVNFPLFETQTKSLVKKASNARFAFNLGYFRPRNFALRANAVRAYSKIDNVLTWIEPEYEYAIKHIKGLKAKHKSFAYTFENDIEVLTSRFFDKHVFRNKRVDEMKCILGNSGVASNNHLDAIDKIRSVNFKEVLIPISYGNSKYTQLLKKSLESKYSNRNITYLDRFMTFAEYIDLFNQYDLFISNSIRPVGMGNIWMALLMGKIVFMNRKNLVYPYLQSLGLQIFDIENICKIEAILEAANLRENCNIAARFLSKTKINEMYLNLFSKETSIYYQTV